MDRNGKSVTPYVFGGCTAFRLHTLRKVLAVLTATPQHAIFGHGCPKKSDLRPDGAWRTVVRLPVSVAATVRTAYACSPVYSRNAVRLSKNQIPSELFRFCLSDMLCLQFIHSCVCRLNFLLYLSKFRGTIGAYCIFTCDSHKLRRMITGGKQK